MNNCYLCGQKFDNNTVIKHDEHIIQQAVGGNLTENDILCSNCGEKLGQEIDRPFSEIFKGIATRLDIKKDRACNNQKSSTQGKYINLRYKFMSLTWLTEHKKMKLSDFQYQYNQFCNEIKEIDVIWKDFKVSPVKPFHKYIENNKKVVIYANQKNAKKYKKTVESEIAKKFKNDEQPEITICDDLEGIVEYPFKMNSQSFKKGLAKIAIGFASKYHIKREDLPLVLEIDKNTKQGKIKDKILAIQFYPLSIIDKLIEIQKNEFEHYPYHNLILFTIDYDSTPNGKRVLICYVELFSTFQWYIVLNEEYYGEPIYEYFAQQILKKEDYVVNLGRRYYKERNIWLQPLGITEEYVEKKYQERKDKNKSKFEVEEELIQENIIKQKYKFNFEEYINHMISRISDQVLIYKNKQNFNHINNDATEFLKNKNIINEYEKLFENSENLIKFKRNLNLFLSQNNNEKYDRDEEIFSILSYRRFFYDDSFRDYYAGILEQYKTLVESSAFKRYGYIKMNMLNGYIQAENIKHKIQTYEESRMMI